MVWQVLRFTLFAHKLSRLWLKKMKEEKCVEWSWKGNCGELHHNPMAGLLVKFTRKFSVVNLTRIEWQVSSGKLHQNRIAGHKWWSSPKIVCSELHQHWMACPKLWNFTCIEWWVPSFKLSNCLQTLQWIEVWIVDKSCNGTAVHQTAGKCCK